MARTGQETLAGATALARSAAAAAADAFATDVQVLDLHEFTPFFDFFVICTADNTRQLRALSLRVVEALREAGAELRRSEGEPESGWVVLDYGTVVVHLFTPEQRQYYRLEERWSHAPKVLVIQ